jgi:hypothetical protein
MQSRILSVSISAIIFAMALTTTGCGGSSENTSLGGPIEIEVSQLFITITNKSGMAITDIKLEVIPTGGQTSYGATHYRLENSEKKDFSLGDLRGSDGMNLNLRVHKPDRVRVTATDIDSTAYDIEIPWS